AKADYRRAEVKVPNHREVVGKVCADHDTVVWRSGASQASRATLQQTRDDGRNAKMFGGHGPLPSVHFLPNVTNSNTFAHTLVRRTVSREGRLRIFLVFGERLFKNLSHRRGLEVFFRPGHPPSRSKLKIPLTRW